MSHHDVCAQIAQLFIYPIKSCAGVEVQEALLTPDGFLYDRHWMLIDDDNRFLTQREWPQMALIQPQLTAHELRVNAPNWPELVVPIEADGAVLDVFIWDDTVSALDMGAHAQAWFSQILGVSARLVRFNAQKKRACSSKYTGNLTATTQFSDGYPILVTSSAAVTELSQKLVDKGFAPIDQRRFRPNLVLSGLVAHDEDQLGDIYIQADAHVLLRNVKPCERCPIPSVDPDTGVYQPEAVSDTLLTYRRNAQRNGEVTFGMNAIVVDGAGQTIRVGQQVAADYVF